MPCSSSEGMADAYREDPHARDRIAAMQKVLDDHADSLCFLREIVADLMGGQPITQEFRNRLIDRRNAHREFDKKEGR